MKDKRPVRADALAAGSLLIASMLACAAAGFGLGTLIDLGVPLGLGGFFVGLIVGFWLVYARYRRI